MQLDPNFAGAYANIAGAYANAGEEASSIEFEKKAYALRDRVSAREKLEIEATYHWIVTGDFEKESATEELYRQTYPREAGPVNNLAVGYCLFLGQFQKAVEVGNEAIRLSPYVPGAFGAVGCGHLGLNHIDEAKTFLEDALPKHPDSFPVHFYTYLVNGLLGNEAGMEREIQWATKEGNTQGGGLLAYGVAGRAFNAGSLKRARELTTQGAQIAKENNLKDSAAEFIAFQALMDAQVGSVAAAKERAAASLAVSRVRNNLPIVALALALAGDSSQAQRITEELRTRYPADTVINDVFVPCSLAILESSRGNAAKAIELLQTTSRYELGPGFGFNPIYIRGLTYLREKKGQEAAAEFQKILNQRALGATMPVFSLSHVGIARAYALTGDTAKSRKFYQDFLALWKDADPDIPILKEAKGEYAKLQ